MKLTSLSLHMNTIMKYIILFFTLLLQQAGAFAQSKHLLFKTAYGEFKVVLFDFTPHHRDLICEAISKGEYKNALFNRVISNFVVQGGEHDIDIEKREKDTPLASRKRLSPEFDLKAFHKMGALGAGRDGNEAKASFLNQIYFVVGKTVTAEELNALEKKKGIKFTKKQRKEYLQNGGLPRLDHDYTVFGQVYEGFNVLMDISKIKTNELDYPVEPVLFDVSVIDK